MYSDYSPRAKTLLILLRMLAFPYKYTRKEIAQHFGFSVDVVNSSIEAFRSVGFQFDQDKQHYRCAILPRRGFEELEHLKSFTAADKRRIKAIIQEKSSDKETFYLLNKIDSLYDFQKLGIRALRRPELEKMEKLETAMQKKYKVLLKNYRSNSNEIRDRKVECFDINPSAGMIQVVEVNENDAKLRHFKLSRIERIEVLNEPWTHEEKHYRLQTDVFRIADNNRIPICLTLDIYALNALQDSFPQAQSEILPGKLLNTYDFQTNVNHKFLGITNFIMSNFEHIIIVYPQNLKDHIASRAQFILKKMDDLG